ncbi:MAG: YdcH family protein [Endozoicomonas sp.]|uniref:YdcH family protein n=1 Tax=Endozoicomonas sp. TaxID=1892382 RepID=UPI003D9B0A26
MLRTKHNLNDDFALMQEQVSQLKTSDPGFQKLAREYHQLDHQVRGLEMREVPTSDEHFTHLKRKRVHLKDALYRCLKK